MNYHSHNPSKEPKPAAPRPGRVRGLFAFALVAAIVVAIAIGASADVRAGRAGAEYDAALHAVLLDLAKVRISMTSLTSRLDGVEVSVESIIRPLPASEAKEPAAAQEPKHEKPTARAHRGRKCRSSKH